MKDNLESHQPVGEETQEFPNNQKTIINHKCRLISVKICKILLINSESRIMKINNIQQPKISRDGKHRRCLSWLWGRTKVIINSKTQPVRAYIHLQAIQGIRVCPFYRPKFMRKLMCPNLKKAAKSPSTLGKWSWPPTWVRMTHSNKKTTIRKNLDMLP